MERGNKDIRRFFKDFGTGWILLAVLIIASIMHTFGNWTAGDWTSRIILIFFLAYIALKPMNAVYAFIGTKGSISHFVQLIIVINIIFSFIYYCGFFHNAGITYDSNQPYISYGMFKDSPKSDSTFVIVHEIRGIDTEASHSLYISKRIDNKGLVYKDTLVVITPARSITPYYEEEHIYKRINLITVIQNTALTSLMQEPTDLFATGVTFNNIKLPEEQDLNGCNDYMMSRLFSWILVLQVFISWIFFGVFISILYNKFRYES